jgi:aconitate hydratase
LQFKPGENATGLGLTGAESFDVIGLGDDLEPRSMITIVAHGTEGETSFEAIVRLDGGIEVNSYRNGGILPTVLRRLASE